MPDPSSSQLAGNLSTMNLADLLQWICLGHKTGTLHLQNGRVRKQVYIRDGKLVSAGSNLSRERLGQFLLHHGRITEENLRAALSEQQSTGKSLGQIFCDRAVLDQTALMAILKLKAEETIYDLFLWNEGNFHFDADKIPEWAETPLSLDVTRLIMEGVRRKDEMGLIRQVLPTNRIILGITGQGRDGAGALGPFDRRLFALVERRLSVSQIAEQSRAPEFVLLKRLHDFIEQGLLEVVEDLSHRQRPPDQLSFDEGLEACRKSLAAEELNTALEHLAALRAQAADEPGGIMEIEPLEKSAAELIYSTMISPNHIPKLKRSLDELVVMTFDAVEGFIVSRIDGVMDIRAVVQTSPVNELATLLIFRRLVDEGVIDLTGTSDIQPRRG